MIVLMSVGICLSMFSWGILWRNCSILYKTICRGDKSKKQVALTFDDGPNPEFTNQILDILKAYNAKATFFCVGRFAEIYPDVIWRIHREGHLLANHTYEHSWRMYFWGPYRVMTSIEKTGKIFEGIIGRIPVFYRAPVGIKTPPQMFAVWRLGLKFVGWTRWALDGGQFTMTSENTRRLIKKARKGDIFLLHDGKLHANGSVLEHMTHNKAIAEQMPLLIEGLIAREYELVTLETLLSIPGYLEARTASEKDTATLRGIIGAMFNTFLHEHISPFKVSLAIAIGIVIGCSPFFGLHALIGLIFASKLRFNKLAMIAGTNISNPLTGPFVIMASIQVGFRILYGSWLTFNMNDVSTQSIWHLGNKFLVSWLVGFPLVGVAIALAVIAFLYPVLLIRQCRKTA